MLEADPDHGNAEKRGHFCIVTPRWLVITFPMVSEKPWTPVDVLRLLMAWLLLLCGAQLIVAQFAPAAAFQGNTNRMMTLVVQMLGFHVAALVLVGVLLFRRGISWGDAFGLGTPRLGFSVGIGVLVGLLVLAPAWALGQLSALVLEGIGFPVKPQQAVQMVQSAASTGERALTALMAVGLAPVVEEVLFRGIIYPTVKQVGYPRIAIWGTAFFFAAIHGTPAIFVPLFFLGALLAHLYERTGTLLVPITVHAMFNLVNFLWLTNPELVRRWFGPDA